jgi:hypothetical protein
MSRPAAERKLPKEAKEYLHACFTKHPERTKDIRGIMSHAYSGARQLAVLILHLPPGREQSCALTKLEECLFWMRACIERNQPAILEHLQRNAEEGEGQEDGTTGSGTSEPEA